MPASSSFLAFLALLIEKHVIDKEMLTELIDTFEIPESRTAADPGLLFCAERLAAHAPPPGSAREVARETMRTMLADLDRPAADRAATEKQNESLLDYSGIAAAARERGVRLVVLPDWLVSDKIRQDARERGLVVAAKSSLPGTRRYELRGSLTELFAGGPLDVQTERCVELAQKSDQSFEHLGHGQMHLEVVTAHGDAGSDEITLVLHDLG